MAEAGFSKRVRAARKAATSPRDQRASRPLGDSSIAKEAWGELTRLFCSELQNLGLPEGLTEKELRSRLLAKSVKASSSEAANAREEIPSSTGKMRRADPDPASELAFLPTVKEDDEWQKTGSLSRELMISRFKRNLGPDFDELKRLCALSVYLQRMSKPDDRITNDSVRRVKCLERVKEQLDLTELEVPDLLDEINHEQVSLMMNPRQDDWSGLSLSVDGNGPPPDSTEVMTYHREGQYFLRKVDILLDLIAISKLQDRRKLLARSGRSGDKSHSSGVEAGRHSRSCGLQ